MDQNKVVHDSSYYNGSYDSAIEVLSVINRFANPRTIVDIGGGTGAWINAAKKVFNNPVVYCIDEISSDKVDSSEFLQYDISTPIKFEHKIDMTICLEVAEHLPEDKSDVLIKSLTDSSDFVLFSAAIPGQGGHGHINEQIPSYWAKKFNNLGYLPVDFLRKRIWENDKICWWYKQNIIPYIKKELVIRNDSLMSEYVESTLERLLIIHPNCSSKHTSDYKFI